MAGWVVGGVYALGYVALWRTVTWFLVSDISVSGNVSGADLAFSAAAGSVLTLGWPLILVGLGVRHVYLARTDSVRSLVVPRAARRQLLLEERERRIRELERDLKLDG